MTNLAYNYDTAAAATGLSVTTIRRAIRAGNLKAKQQTNGGRVVILAADLQAWLEGMTDAEAAS